MMKKHKNQLIAAVVIIAILAVAFFMGGAQDENNGSAVAGSAQMLQEPNITEKPLEVEPPVAEPSVPEQPAEQEDPAATLPVETPEQSVMEINPETGKDQYNTDPVPEGKPVPVEPQDTQVGADAYTCTLSIACNTILNNIDLCDPEKVELVPADGWILEPITVTFYEGESVFDVLQRVCREKKIHMEFMDTPIYNSAYIEGLGNFYEFDCGPLSGWMYKVNEWFPNYGCSRYQLKNGDVICWVYTCDLGSDIGGRNAL